MIVEKCKYTEDHEWVYLDEEIATIGISNHAIEELGEIVYVELPDKESSVEQSEEFGTIESVKTVSSLFAPVSGKVVDTNDHLGDSPNLINDSPYEEGWLIKVEINNIDDYEKLMTYEEYQTFLETQ